MSEKSKKDLEAKEISSSIQKFVNESQTSPNGSLFRFKLTKKIFMQLPEGLFLVSNCFYNRGQSVFEEVIDPQPLRDQQWLKIVLSGASDRTCIIFRDATNYQQWLTSFGLGESKVNNNRMIQ